MAVAGDSLSRRFEALRPHLNERQRRLWLGAGAPELGPGGAGGVGGGGGGARRLVNSAQVGWGWSRRRSEWPRTPFGGVAPSSTIRRLRRWAPRGRPVAVANAPKPMTRRWWQRWNNWSTRTAAGIRCHRCGGPASPPGRWPRRCASAVTRSASSWCAGCSRPWDTACRPTSKTAEGRQHPDRDAQFGYLNDQVKAHQNAGCPVISVDTKKKELVGNCVEELVDGDRD